MSFVNDDSEIENKLGKYEERLVFDYSFEMDEVDFLDVSLTHFYTWRLTL